MSAVPGLRFLRVISTRRFFWQPIGIVTSTKLSVRAELN